MWFFNRLFIAALIICLLPVQGKALFGIKARQEQKHLLSDARTAYENGEYEKAIDLSQKLLLTNAPKRRIRRVYLVLGPSFKAQGDYARALLVYNEALEFYPKDIEISLNLADIYSIGGLYDQAIAIYNHILVLDPKNADAKLGLAKNYLRQGFYTRSIKYFQEYLAKEKAPDASVLTEYAESLYEGKKYEEALKAIEDLEAVQKEPSADLKFLKAKVYKALGYKAESFKEMNQAYLLNIENERIAYTYALWLLYSHQYDKAMEIIKYFEKSESGSERLNLFIKFIVYLKTDNSQKAEESLKLLRATKGDSFLDKLADKILETHFNIKAK